MPYSGPVAVARPGHRRSTSLFSDEKGSGTFQPLGSLPRRTPKTGGAMFHFRGDDDDSSSSSHSDNDDDHPPPLKINPNNTLRISLEPIPFPKASPLSPSPAVNSPTRPAYTRTSSTPVLLSNGKPLKSSLKSSSSSPNIPNIPVVQFPQIVRSLHLRARSAPSTPSLDMSSVIAASCPSTPKNVHFSSDLEDVRVFNRTAKPASVSRPPGDETETETENENARDWSGRIENKFFPSAFPFPRLPDPAPLPPNQKRPFQLDSSSYPVPNPSPSSSANVHLESLTLTATEPPSLTGSVLVKNVCFEKHVYLRFTLDDWQTTSEVGTKFVASLTDLPPTFVPRTFGDMLVASSSTDTPPTWDRFEFSIRLEDYLAHLDSKTLWLVVRYTAPGTGEWWDNNGGRNYRVMFKRGELKERSISAPSAPPSTLQASTVAPPVVSKPFSAQSPSRSPQLQQALSLATTQRLSKFSLKNYAKPTGPVPVPGSTPPNMSPTTPKSELVVNLIGPTPTQDKQQMPRTRSSPPSSSDTTPMPSPGLEAPPPSVDAQVLSASLPPLKTQPLTRNSENGTFTGLQWGWTAPRSPSPDRSPLSPDTPSSLVSSIGGLKPPAGLHPTKRSPPPLAIPPVPALDRSRTSSGSTSSSDSLSSLEDNFRELAVRLASPPRVPSPQIRAQSGQLSPPQGESPVLSPVLQHPHPQKTLQTLHALRTSPVPSPLSGSPVNSGDVEIPGDVTPPVSASEAESMYKAFVRQWCFATTQNTPPATIVEGLTGITA